MEKLWTTAEVARFLGITDVDVEGLVRQGKLTGYKLAGQFLRFRPDQVQALKGTITFRPNPSIATAASVRTDAPPVRQARDFFYFYDFYIVSASLLAVLVVYLIIS